MSSRYNIAEESEFPFSYIVSSDIVQERINELMTHMTMTREQAIVRAAMEDYERLQRNKIYQDWLTKHKEKEI